MPNQTTHTRADLARLKRSGRLWLAVCRDTGRVDAVGRGYLRLRAAWPLLTHRIDHVDHCGVKP